jgi:transposase
MRLEAKKYLFDIRRAGSLLTEFTAGKNFDAYQADAMLRAAVEREFEIIGEALAQLARLDAAIAARITHGSPAHHLVPQPPYSWIRGCGRSAGVGRRGDQAGRIAA